MGKEWYSLAELVGIPGLPGTVPGIRFRATRDGWKSRPREGSGGGKEYHHSSLPKPAQDYLLRVAVQEAVAQL